VETDEEIINNHGEEVRPFQSPLPPVRMFPSTGTTPPTADHFALDNNNNINQPNSEQDAAPLASAGAAANTRDDPGNLDPEGLDEEEMYKNPLQSPPPLVSRLHHPPHFFSRLPPLQLEMEHQPSQTLSSSKPEDQVTTSSNSKSNATNENNNNKSKTNSNDGHLALGAAAVAAALLVASPTASPPASANGSPHGSVAPSSGQANLSKPSREGEGEHDDIDGHSANQPPRPSIEKSDGGLDKRRRSRIDSVREELMILAASASSSPVSANHDGKQFNFDSNSSNTTTTTDTNQVLITVDQDQTLSSHNNNTDHHNHHNHHNHNHNHDHHHNHVPAS